MLTDAKCRRARCADGKRQVKLTDARGLFLLVTVAGGRYWRLNYRISGRQKGYDVSISFETMTCDIFANEDGKLYEANHRKRQRPWTVYAKNRHHKSFKDTDKAVFWFMAMASEINPVK